MNKFKIGDYIQLSEEGKRAFSKGDGSAEGLYKDGVYGIIIDYVGADGYGIDFYVLNNVYHFGSPESWIMEYKPYDIKSIEENLNKLIDKLNK